MAINEEFINELQENIRIYKPGRATLVDDELYETLKFKKDLDIGLFGVNNDVSSVIECVRAAYDPHSQGFPSSVDRECLTKSISLVKRDPLSSTTVSAGDVGCVVLVTSEGHISKSSAISAEIDTVRKDKGWPPIIVILTNDQETKEQINERKHQLEKIGVLDIFEMPHDTQSHDLSKETQLELLKLLERCTIDGDGINIIRQLEMRDPCLAHGVKLRLMIGRGSKEAKQQLRQENAKLSDTCHNLEAEISKLREKLFNEMKKNRIKVPNKRKKSSPGKPTKKVVQEGQQMSLSQIDLDNRPGTSAQNLSNSEEVGDEFDEILKEISSELHDPSDIENLGHQLYVNRGDIKRALQTNMRFEEVSSRGTLSMLQRWYKKSESTSQARAEMRRALVGAKLIRIADQHLREDKEDTVKAHASSSSRHSLLRPHHNESERNEGIAKTNVNCPDQSEETGNETNDHLHVDTEHDQEDKLRISARSVDDRSHTLDDTDGSSSGKESSRSRGGRFRRVFRCCLR